MRSLTKDERYMLSGLAKIEFRRWASLPDKQYMADLMSLAISALEQRPGWIDVTEKEPNLGWSCFVWMAGGFPAVIRITNRSLNDRDFTHWMRVPDQPQPKAESTTQVDIDGWIEWGGGERPVAGDVQVEVRFRDGKMIPSEAARYWNWHFHNSPVDIIAYRVIESDGSAE